MLNVFGHFLRPGKQGGVEFYFRNLLAGFEANGADITLLPSHPPRISRFAAEQIDILRIRSGNVLLPNYYVPAVTPKLNISAVIHDLLYTAFPASLPAAKVRWLQWAIPHALKRSDQIIAISDFTKAEILNRYGGWISQDRVHVLHNPIDLARFEHPAPVAPPTQPYVLCPSSGFWHKNVPFLIDLFASRPELAHLTLVLVGPKPSDLGWSANTGTFRRDYQELLRTASVIELGYVSDPQLGMLYREAQCVVFPSRYEGFGMPIMEALCLGAPVVCAAVGAVPELCADLVELVRDTDAPDEWAAAILKASAAPKAERAAELTRLAEILSPRRIARQYLELCG